jgi:hypothetical protein
LTRPADPERVGITIRSPAPTKGRRLCMATERDPHQRLRDVGVIIADDLPQEYAAVVEGLTPDELEVIIAVKERLDEAQRVSKTSMGELLFPP